MRKILNWMGLYTRTQFQRLEQERDNWIDSFKQESRNRDYYRGIVVEIGEAIGKPAYIQDDGGVADSVLCAKVAQLAKERLPS